MLSTLKPVVGSLPSSSAPHGSRVNAPPATMLRVSPKISTSHALQERGKEERVQAQETRAAVSRRDVMGIAAAGLGISLAKPAEAVEVANSGNPISQFLDLLKGLLGTPEPKPEGDEPKTEIKPELPKPKAVGDEEPPVDNKAEPSDPKTEGVMRVGKKGEKGKGALSSAGNQAFRRLTATTTRSSNGDRHAVKSLVRITVLAPPFRRRLFEERYRYGLDGEEIPLGVIRISPRIGVVSVSREIVATSVLHGFNRVRGSDHFFVIEAEEFRRVPPEGDEIVGREGVVGFRLGIGRRRLTTGEDAVCGSGRRATPKISSSPGRFVGDLKVSDTPGSETETSLIRRDANDEVLRPWVPHAGLGKKFLAMAIDDGGPPSGNYKPTRKTPEKRARLRCVSTSFG
nr:histone H1-I-like [Ipomoea batatas]